MTAEFYALRISLLRTKFGGLLRRNTLDKLFVSRWLAGNVPSCTVSVVDVVKECAPKRYVDLYAVVSTLSSPYLQAASRRLSCGGRMNQRCQTCRRRRGYQVVLMSYGFDYIHVPGVCSIVFLDCVVPETSQSGIWIISWRLGDFCLNA